MGGVDLYTVKSGFFRTDGGIVTIHDIPEYLPSGAFRSDATFIDYKVSKA